MGLCEKRNKTDMQQNEGKRLEGKHTARHLSRGQVNAQHNTTQHNMAAHTDAIKLNGVVEGFYGMPWEVSQRHMLFATMVSLGLNAYMYAPKDDPYHRTFWRSLYPQDLIGMCACVDAARLSCYVICSLVSTATPHQQHQAHNDLTCYVRTMSPQSIPLVILILATT